MNVVRCPLFQTCLHLLNIFVFVHCPEASWVLDAFDGDLLSDGIPCPAVRVLVATQVASLLGEISAEITVGEAGTAFFGDMAREQVRARAYLEVLNRALLLRCDG
jgi:hypothetical protein